MIGINREIIGEIIESLESLAKSLAKSLDYWLNYWLNHLMIVIPQWYLIVVFESKIQITKYFIRIFFTSL